MNQKTNQNPSDLKKADLSTTAIENSSRNCTQCTTPLQSLLSITPGIELLTMPAPMTQNSQVRNNQMA